MICAISSAPSCAISAIGRLSAVQRICGPPIELRQIFSRPLTNTGDRGRLLPTTVFFLSTTVLSSSDSRDRRRQRRRAYAHSRGQARFFHMYSMFPANPTKTGGYIFSRVHVTLHPALSVLQLVGQLVGGLVGRSVSSYFTSFINFISLSHFKSF